MHLTCLQDHLNVCPFFEVPCPLGKCKERMMRKEIPDHLNWKCKHRETTCEFCVTKMPLTDLQVTCDLTPGSSSGLDLLIFISVISVVLVSETQRHGVSSVSCVMSKPLLLLIPSPE